MRIGIGIAKMRIDTVIMQRRHLLCGATFCGGQPGIDSIEQGIVQIDDQTLWIGAVRVGNQLAYCGFDVIRILPPRQLLNPIEHRQ